MGWFIAGGILVVGAIVAAFFAVRARRTVRAVTATETYTASRLGELAVAARQASGPGTFRLGCEITGAAMPGPMGGHTSELGQVACVWYHAKVTRRYTDWTYRDGQRRRTTKHEVVSDTVSRGPFALQDATGVVTVEPGDTDVRRAEKLVDRYVPSDDGDAFSFSVMNVPVLGSGDNDTQGYKYEEWVLRQGIAVYVLGDVTDTPSGLVMGPPAEGPHVITTQSEQDLLAVQRTNTVVCAVAAAVAGLAGIALVVTGVVTRLG